MWNVILVCSHLSVEWPGSNQVGNWGDIYTAHNTSHRPVTVRIEKLKQYKSSPHLYPLFYPPGNRQKSAWINKCHYDIICMTTNTNVIKLSPIPFLEKLVLFQILNLVFRISYENHLPNDSMRSNQFTCISCTRDHCQTPPWIHLEGRAASSCPGWLANLPPCDTGSAPWQGAGGQGQGERRGYLVTFV